MRPLSIRASLALWFVGATVGLLIAVSFVLYHAMRTTLVAEFDERLRTRAAALAAACEWEGHGVEFEMEPELAAEFVGTGNGRGAEIRTWPGGEVVGAVGAAVPPGAPSGGPEPVFALTGSADETRVCVLREQVPRSPPRDARWVEVRVVESFGSVVAQLGAVFWFAVLSIAVAVVVVGAFAQWLSLRFVRPLAALGDAASAVRLDSVRPMPRRQNGDEIDRLGAVLDQAFVDLREASDKKARFTADAAHELRNPVAVIQNAAQVALRDGRSEAEVREFLADILSTSKRMGAVVEALLMLARLDGGIATRSFECIDLAAVVADAAAGLPSGGERVAVTHCVVAGVRGDADLLRVLVGNLLGNALQHSRGAGVEVAVRVDAVAGVVLEVTDRGPGVPEPIREEVFERFYRADPAGSRDGAGLGLSIVSAIAAVHGARCRIEDAEPGARVTIQFGAPCGPAGILD